MKPINLKFLLLHLVLFLTLTVNTHADILNSWTTNQLTTNSYYLDNIAYGNGCYVITGENNDFGAIYSSPDGMNWTLRYSGGGPWGLTMRYEGGRFVGVGGGYGATAISTNGTNWTVSTSLGGSFGGAFINNFGHGDMTFGAGTYIEVGDTNGVGNFLTSVDGIDWTPRSSSPSPGGHISSVAYNGSIFVAVGNNDGMSYTSLTGTSWVRRNILGGSQIVCGNGVFIVPLNSKTNQLSVDGVNWGQQRTGLTNQLGKPIFINGVFMAFAGNRLATSGDGTNWFQYTNSIPGRNTDGSLTTDGNHLLSIGNISAPNFTANGFAYISGVLLGVEMASTPPAKLIFSGLIGRNYQIQSADALIGANNWRTNTTLQLTNTPFVWTDSSATNSARFYRGVLLP